MAHIVIGKVRNSLVALWKKQYRMNLLLAVLLCSGYLHGQEERGPALPDGEGKELVTFACSQCHGLRETQILRDGEKGWEEVVNRMVLFGAQLSPSEADAVTHYLATYLGPNSGIMSASASRQNSMGDGIKRFLLPMGLGKELVAARCGAMCHDLERVVSSNRTKADWVSITNNMVQRGLKATPDEINTMIGYLQASFSAGTKPQIVQSNFVKPMPVNNQQPQLGSARAGGEIFLQKCFQCHAVEPGAVRSGPSLFHEMRPPNPKKTAAQIRTILRDGKGKMPAYKDKLSKEDTDNLLAYIRSL